MPTLKTAAPPQANADLLLSNHQPPLRPPPRPATARHPLPAAVPCPCSFISQPHPNPRIMNLVLLTCHIYSEVKLSRSCHGLAFGDRMPFSIFVWLSCQRLLKVVDRLNVDVFNTALKCRATLISTIEKWMTMT